MNILHITTARSWRGGEEQLKLLVRAQRNKNKVTILCPSDGIFYTAQDFHLCDVVPYSTVLGGLPAGSRALLRAIKDLNIDVIHAHDSKAHTLVYITTKIKNIDRPIVVTRHTAFGIQARSSKKYNHLSIRKIICVSDAVRQSMADAIHNPNRLTVIPSSIDFHVQQLNRFSDVYPSDGKKIVAYIAALSGEKRHDVFLDIAEAYCKKHPHKAHFYIVGEGANHASIQASILERNLDSIISMTGYIKDIARKLKGIDILLHTCENEALGTSILQAMAQGIPAVVHNNPGPRTFIIHEENGYLIDKYEIDAYIKALDRLLTDPTWYDKLATNAQLTAQNYHFESQAERIYKLYLDETSS